MRFTHESTGSHEEAVIGSILLQPSLVDEVLEVLCPEDFTSPERGGDRDLKQFFKLLIDLHELGQPIDDIHLVTTQAKKREIAISAAAIANAFSSVPNAAHAVFYARHVAETARLRKLLEINELVSNQLKLPTADSGEIVDYLTAKLKTIDLAAKIELFDAKKSIELFEAGNSDSSLTVFSGIQTFDHNFGGASGGELICLGARLGAGKTAFGWQWTLNALECGQPVLFVSLEMKTRSLMQRHFAASTGIDSLLIRKNDLSIQHQNRIQIEKECFANYPVSIFAPPEATVRQIAAAARLKRSGSGLALIVVDYLQKLKPSKSHKERRTELEQISGDLKSLALELDVPIVALTQLSRQADGAIPRVSHIADSDNIGRDADQVLLLHRKGSTTDLRIEKHRYVADDKAIELFFRNGRFVERQDR